MTSTCNMDGVKELTNKLPTLKVTEEKEVKEVKEMKEDSTANVRTFEEDYTYMVKMFMKMVWMIYDFNEFGAVEIFGSIARMVATCERYFHTNSDVDILVPHNTRHFIHKIEEMIKMNSMMLKFNGKLPMTFTSFKFSEQHSTYGRHFKGSLKFLDSHLDIREIPVDIVCRLDVKATNSWEVFRLSEKRIRMIPYTDMSYYELVENIRSGIVTIYNGSKDILLVLQRFEKLVRKYPEVTFVLDEPDSKNMCPIRSDELSADTMCCICHEHPQSRSGEDSDDSVCSHMILTHCKHTMCFDCAIQLAKTTSDNGLNHAVDCPMCRQRISFIDLAT